MHFFVTLLTDTLEWISPLMGLVDRQFLTETCVNLSAIIWGQKHVSKCYYCSRTLTPPALHTGVNQLRDYTCEILADNTNRTKLSDAPWHGTHKYIVPGKPVESFSVTLRAAFGARPGVQRAPKIPIQHCHRRLELIEHCTVPAI